MITEIPPRTTGTPETRFTNTVAPADRNAALVYLSTLSPNSAHIQRSALNAIARVLTGGLCDVYALPWGQVRYRHLLAVRAILQQTYAPRTVRRYMNALKGTVRHAYLLRQVDSDTYMRTMAMPPVRCETKLPAESGRQVADEGIGFVLDMPITN